MEKILKCKYCGKPIPQKTRDAFGRRKTKIKKFCSFNCYKKWWREQNPDYYKEYYKNHPEKY